ncbi:hypothetical protein [Lactococcus garvieae]|uniref:hypothetical protein n=1 Tax=Lactococcus garvieae TaxID=1363 RepID=UPI0002FE9CC6|nr:hypothetical protein [Lactococcus garvieae]
MSDNVVFLVEGEILDVRISKEIERFFLNNETNLKIIPYKTNIYNLYKQLKDDDFETDIISVLEERDGENPFFNSFDSIGDISEIYLFFDYDGHNYQDQRDCKEIGTEQLLEMLNFFDNETEQGKLYISYPMIEAIHHCSLLDTSQLIYNAQCINAFSKRHINGMKYKTISKLDKDLLLVGEEHYSEEEWLCIITNFLWGISYLGDREGFIPYSEYQNGYSPLGIFEKQNTNYISTSEKILILSGYPQFILDYFGNEYYNQIVNQSSFFTQVKKFNFQ